MVMVVVDETELGGIRALGGDALDYEPLLTRCHRLSWWCCSSCELLWAGSALRVRLARRKRAARQPSLGDDVELVEFHMSRKRAPCGWGRRDPTIWEGLKGMEGDAHYSPIVWLSIRDLQQGLVLTLLACPCFTKPASRGDIPRR